MRAADYASLRGAYKFNVNGFPIRVAASIEQGEQISLVAAGMVDREDEVVDDFAERVAATVLSKIKAEQDRERQVAALRDKFKGD